MAVRKPVAGKNPTGRSRCWATGRIFPASGLWCVFSVTLKYNCWSTYLTKFPVSGWQQKLASRIFGCQETWIIDILWVVCHRQNDMPVCLTIFYNTEEKRSILFFCNPGIWKRPIQRYASIWTFEGFAALWATWKIAAGKSNFCCEPQTGDVFRQLDLMLNLKSIHFKLTRPEAESYLWGTNQIILHPISDIWNTFVQAEMVHISEKSIKQKAI